MICLGDVIIAKWMVPELFLGVRLACWYVFPGVPVSEHYSQLPLCCLRTYCLPLSKWLKPGGDFSLKTCLDSHVEWGGAAGEKVMPVCTPPKVMKWRWRGTEEKPWRIRAQPRWHPWECVEFHAVVETFEKEPGLGIWGLITCSQLEFTKSFVFLSLWVGTTVLQP